MEVAMPNKLAVLQGAALCLAAGAAFAGGPPAQAPASASSSSSGAAQPASQCKPIADTTVAPRKGACTSNMGSSFDDKQLNATGASNAGDALRMSDPSVSYHK
jgi:hypothetical protein